jgi:hypothetical protein
MPKNKPLTPFVESYRFWDVVTLWARERLENEQVVARVLAKAVICDGLKLQSVDERWLNKEKGEIEFRGYPYVGFCAKPNLPVSVLRANALEHLLAVVQRAAEPDSDKLWKEFVYREDFRMWAASIELALPTFWFGTVVSRGL